MSERKYNRLYQLTVAHSFYSDSESADFSFSPMGNAPEFFRSHRILFKDTQTGFDLVYQTDDGGTDPFNEIAESNKLLIGVAVENENVLNFTNFPVKSDSSDLYFAAGKYSTAALSFAAKKTRQLAFQETYLYANNQAKLVVEDASGRIVFSKTLDGLKDDDDPTKFHYRFSVQLANDALGEHTIKTYLDGILEDETEVFVYDRYQWSNIIGVIELELDENIVYDNNLPYQASLNLAASSIVWTYSIELTRDYTNGNFGVTDTGGGFVFNEINVPADYKKGKTVTFESTTAIVKREQPRKDFDLVVTSDDQDLTLSGLPNPSPYISNSTIYLKI